MPDVVVTPLPNGPLEVTGPIEIAGRNGEPLTETTYLCRCGRSANKPFCDGSHARTGWTEECPEPADWYPSGVSGTVTLIPPSRIEGAAR